MNEIFLDTETTGLSYQDRHKIVEIACIETKDLIPTGKIFHKLINPMRDVPDEAFKIHGFSTEFLKSKQTFDKHAEDFIDFIKDKKLIIHNASFDLGFLNHELGVLNKTLIKKENVIDSLEIARSKFPGTSNSLDALCKKFNIDLSKRTKHNALLDCELLREVYINLLGAKEPRLMFAEESETYDNNINSNSKKIVNYYKNILKVSEAELEKHKIILKKEIPKNYY